MTSHDMMAAVVLRTAFKVILCIFMGRQTIKNPNYESIIKCPKFMTIIHISVNERKVHLSLYTP
jgi:hypothetical protein